MAHPYRLERVESVLSLKDKAYAAIKSAILSLQLEPGMALVESELAEQLGLSKTPVRDALQELEREGFVTRVFFKGTYVTDVTTKDLVEVFQIRAVLEGMAARLAAPLLSSQELDDLAQNLAASEVALAEGSLQFCSERGMRLHEAIIGKADNQRLALIIHNLDDHVQRFRAVSDRVIGRLTKSVVEHRRVLEALCTRDPEMAEYAMRHHLLSVLQDLTAPEESTN